MPATLSVRIRPMRERDIPAVSAIDRQIYPRAWPAYLFRRLLRAGLTCRVAEWHGRIAGYAVMAINPRWVHVMNLAVGRRYRRRDIGRQLMVDLITTARAAGRRGMWLEVRPGSRAAIRLYRRLGFRRVGRRRHYYREPPATMDAVIMTLRLKRY